MEIISKSASQTERIGEELVVEILKNAKNNAFVIGLRGDLGGGKTTFLKGLARGLGVDGTVLSPTFIIFRRYDIKKGHFKRFYHFDCYRIESENEMVTLGFNKIVADSENIVAIEWSERVGRILTDDTLKIDFEFIDEETRKISFDWN